MTTTEIKAELNRAKEAKRAYKLAKDKADDYEHLLIGGKSIRYDSDGSKSERKGNPVENAYCQLADYKADAERLFKEYAPIKANAIRLIKHVKNIKQRRVLEDYYLDDMSWKDIARSMQYSVRHIHRLHGYALYKIAKTLDMS